MSCALYSTAWGRGVLRAAAAVLALAGLGLGGAVAQPSQAVARVAIAVGDAVRVSPAGTTQPLQAGASLHPGDRVLTGPDALAVLVFTDEGRVSLRPDSELLIRHYEVDAAGARTRIEFELLRGTLRQISGNASRQQPERYRLNTPIAVIGVRGTDFLAKTSAEAVETFVHEGRIVLVNPGDPCVDANPAACKVVASASAASALRYLRLSAAGQIEQRDFRPGEVERIFGVEVARASRPNGANAIAAARAAAPELPAGTRLISDSIFVASGLEDRGGASSPVSVLSEQARAVVDTAALLSRPLVWGRFSSADAVASSMLTPYAAASSGRHVTVGELGQYALWRVDPTGRLDSSLSGNVSFALRSAEAWYVQDAQASPAQVRGASLNIDFDRSTFGATVAASHPVGGSVALDVSGKVSSQGVFFGIDGSGRIAGAVTRSGREAGFLFNKDTVSGLFRGITLWGR